MQEKFTFSLLNIQSKDERMYFEAKLIGTVSNCTECMSSENWLGNFSPVEKIRKSGLWQVIKLYSDPLEENEIEYISNSLVRKK